MKPKRVAIYARVSTIKDQKPELQIDELLRYCQSRGFIVTYQIIDQGFSGKTDQRPGLKQLIALTKSRKIDIVCVVKLDRLFRSLKHMVNTVQDFTDIGVEFISIRDQVDLTTASGRLMLHMLSAMAEFERELIRERTIVGQEYARRQGKTIGRPMKHDRQAIIELRRLGCTYRQIQDRLKVPQGVIYDAIKEHTESPQFSAPENPVETGGAGTKNIDTETGPLPCIVQEGKNDE